MPSIRSRSARFLGLLLCAPFLLAAHCKDVRTFTPSATGFTTFRLHAGTIDTSGASCSPATPPAPAEPNPPGASQLLVGYQDWRNTVTDAGGAQCQTSNAKRWEGVVAFDMSAVIADLRSAPYKLVSGSLVYRIANTFRNPGLASATPMCPARLELAAAAPPGGGVIDINGVTGGNFPPSAAPSLGALPLPSEAPLAGSATHGPATVEAQGFGNFPRVTVDVTPALNDWLSSQAPTLALALPPTGPTLAQLGLPPNPVPVTRSTAECRTYVDTMTLTVNVAR